jgi:hypothetical protein
VIVLFVVLSMKHFIDEAGGFYSLDFFDVERTTPNFGFVLGIIAFSYSQSVQIPQIIMDSNPNESFKIPLFISLSFVYYFE